MLLLVLVPLIAIIPLAGVRVVEEAKAIRAAGDIHDQSLIAQRISGLVSALADERDHTEVALSGRGFRADSGLSQARNTTTDRVRAFNDAMEKYRDSVSALPPRTRQLGERAQGRLGDIEPLRDSVIRLRSGAPTFSAYSTIIDNLLAFDSQLSANTSDQALGNLVRTLGSVEQTHEHTSRERGYLYDVMSTGHATLEQTEDLEQAQAQFNSALESTLDNAPTGVVNDYQSTVGGNRIARADGTIQAVSAAAQEGTSIRDIGVDASTTFGDLTTKLEAIRAVKARVNEDMSKRASELLSEGRIDLYANLGIILVVVLLSLVGALVLARSVVRPLRTLQSSALEVADVRLPDAVRKLRESRSPDGMPRTERIGVDSRDEVGQVARAFDRVHAEAVRLATEQALMRDNVNTMFTNLSRRSESLVLRQLSLIDELESGEQNPTQLSSLFKLDHLATRMRRNNESLLVLAGGEQGRRWDRQVLLLDVVRAAIAEIEEYERVNTGELPDVAVSGPAATDVVHLVAELIENATSFSAPETEVLVNAEMLNGEIMLTVSDTGLGIGADELRAINERLARPPVVDVTISRRMGLFVVGRLALRHRIRVWLTTSGTGGTSAVVVLPAPLVKQATDLDSDTGAAFGAALRPSSYDTLDISDILYPGSLPEPGRETAFDMQARAEAGPPPDGFGWFTDQAGTDELSGGPGWGTSGGFSWFDEPNPGDAPPPPDMMNAAPVERLPIYEAIESEWFDADGRGPGGLGGSAGPGGPGGSAGLGGPGGSAGLGGPGAGPGTGAAPGLEPGPGPERGPEPGAASPPSARYAPGDPGLPERGTPPGGGETVQAATRPAPAPAPASHETGRERHTAEQGGEGQSSEWQGGAGRGGAATSAASRPADGGMTARGLPRRVPRGNLKPGSVAAEPPRDVAPATAPPRSPAQLQDRLSRFSQGVRHGKDTAGNAGDGVRANGPDAR
nr:nitrate- and nitrite sensing domain-containing protein [Streptomyces sp. HNM0575]